MNKEKLSKVIENYIDINNNFGFENNLDIVNLCQEINSELDYFINIEFREDTSDSWLQLEYYSDKLEKNIIFDYDFQSSFEDMDEFIIVYLDNYKTVKKFEENISIPKLSKKDKFIINKAFDLLINQESDENDYTKLLEKIGL